ncbi:hypothetical protein BN1723_014942, partial [Verticillium longisporum]
MGGQVGVITMTVHPSAAPTAAPTCPAPVTVTETASNCGTAVTVTETVVATATPVPEQGQQEVNQPKKYRPFRHNFVDRRRSTPHDVRRNHRLL